jgi:hypothetical protein
MEGQEGELTAAENLGAGAVADALAARQAEEEAGAAAAAHALAAPAQDAARLKRASRQGALPGARMVLMALNSLCVSVLVWSCCTGVDGASDVCTGCPCSALARRQRGRASLVAKRLQATDRYCVMLQNFISSSSAHSMRQLLTCSLHWLCMTIAAQGLLQLQTLVMFID